MSTTTTGLPSALACSRNRRWSDGRSSVAPGKANHPPLVSVPSVANVVDARLGTDSVPEREAH